MMDDLQQAYTAYQSAVVNLRNPKVISYPPYVAHNITCRGRALT